MCSDLHQNSGYQRITGMDLSQVEDPLYMRSEQKCVMSLWLFSLLVGQVLRQVKARAGKRVKPFTVNVKWKQNMYNIRR